MTRHIGGGPPPSRHYHTKHKQQKHFRCRNLCFCIKSTVLLLLVVFYGYLMIVSVHPLERNLSIIAESTPAATTAPSGHRLSLHATAPHADNTSTSKNITIMGNEKSGLICAPWTVNMDHWWTHHPDWDIEFENDDMFCFARKEDTSRFRLYQRVYQVQHQQQNYCTAAKEEEEEVLTFYMWSSGWGSDFLNIADGLTLAVQQNRPFQVDFRPEDRAIGWHMAALKDGSKPVCPTRDINCYFLPLSSCSPGPVDSLEFVHGLRSNMTREEWGWLTFYATREQQWLRRRVYEYIRDRAPTITSPCAVIHVRRSDVVLHQSRSRKYYAVGEYLNKLSATDIRDILLITDDADAVSEALEFHPEYHWMYLNRTRFHGTEGGWENALPSQEPAEEVVILLALQRLVRNCDTIVHGHSLFSELLYTSMTFTGRNISKLRVDEDGDVFSEKNQASAQALQKKLDALRQGTNKGGNTKSD